MSDDVESGGGAPGGDEQEPQDILEQILRSFLGPQAAEDASRVMRERGFDLSSFGGGLGESLGALANPAAMAQAMGQFRYLMSSTDGPVNWRMVDDISRQAAFKSGDPRLTAAQANQARQALSIADLWLDPVTDFTVRGGEKESWTRMEWIDQTLPAWKEIVNPIATNISRSMTEIMQQGMAETSGIGVPEQIQSLMGPMQQMMPKMIAMSFGGQVGQALAAMSQDTLGASDSGLPLTQPGLAALIPTNLAAFADGLDDGFEEVQQYVAVREMAHARLFASVPWLRHDLNLAIIRYAEEIAFDMEALADAAHSIDPSNPASLEQALSGGIFSAEPTEAQERALERLETLLSLIEGWVETVTSDATRAYLPGADKLKEMMRRRRVTGSSADMLLGQLVGISLRPRQARAAAQIFRRLEDQGGSDARDAIWAHPDTIPTSEDLNNPADFRLRRIGEDSGAADDFDRDLERLLAGTLGWDASVPVERRSDFGARSFGDGSDPEGDTGGAGIEGEDADGDGDGESSDF